ncbi:hypothetical protein OHS70_20370 [Streptomyces sp. NBC_00390]|uniref:hypothetical protein n=1 Tax=Streptomyces sp. NBC_00390 TaxID=2975736 RepID=UPI002E1CEB0A
MLRHAIAPSARFVKASHDVVRHRRLNSDAKILILLVQGLPEKDVEKALSKHAEDLGWTNRQYQKAKKLLVEHGYLHEWQWQGDRGRWCTDQLMSNVTLTREEASGIRSGAERPPAPPETKAAPPEDEPPTDEPPVVEGPAVGGAGPRDVGDAPVKKNREKNTPHPPTEAPPAPLVQGAPEVAVAERVLLSLRHTHRELLLGVREARGLAEAAAEWLRRGFSVAELRQALTSGLPPEGVRSAAGFLRHRLVHKLPAPAAPEGPPPVAAPGLMTCKGPGEEHVFRPVDDETHCGRCRTSAASAAAEAAEERPRSGRVSWRTLVAEAVADV